MLTSGLCEPVKYTHLQKFVYMLPCTGDESMLFGNTLFNVREDKKSGSTVFSGDKSPLAKFTHKGLDSFHIGFALLDTTGNALVKARECTCY